VQNVDVLFFMLGWDRYRFDKKDTETHYAELVCLHPMGSLSRVVHSGASKVQNIKTQFFMLGWAWCGFHKKRTGTCYTELMFWNTVRNFNTLFFMLGWARYR
jgi:hypothetical protein